MTGAPNEISIQVHFLKLEGGRYYVFSPDIPGLHLGGSDWSALKADLEPIMKDLLWFNSEIIVDTIRWVPGLDQVSHKLNAGDLELGPDGKATFVIELKRAA